MTSEAWLIKVLGETLNVDPAVQKGAEEALAQAGGQAGTNCPLHFSHVKLCITLNYFVVFLCRWSRVGGRAGYGLALARVSLSSVDLGIDLGIRQISYPHPHLPRSWCVDHRH